MHRPSLYFFFVAAAFATEVGLSTPLFTSGNESLDPATTESRTSLVTPRRQARARARMLTGFAESSSSKDPELAARAFMQNHSTLFLNVAADRDLKTIKTERTQGGNHTRFQQVHNGIPVLNADVVVSTDEQGVARTVVDNTARITNLETLPLLSVLEAISAARTHLQVKGPSIGTPDAASLFVVPVDTDRAVLAYRVTITTEDPAGDWEVLVDARSGMILQTTDRFVLHNEAHYGTGSGYVYLSDPLSAARQRYGTPGFVDDNDKDSDSLRFYRSRVQLDSLVVENGVYVLQGPACTVTNIESPEDPLAFTSASPDGFAFTRNQPGFEAVNAYYHITKAYRRLEQLGFTSAALRQLRIDPHGFQGQDNSHYSPTGNWISFGTGGVDDAEDADVIWHEYMHAIIYTTIPTWGGGETAPLGEGLADYWAASYSRSLRQWQETDEQRDWVYHWDGHNQFWSGRTVLDNNTYPFGSITPHAGGQIVSSTLIGIQDALGRDITDRLVIKSLFYLGANATAPDFALALVQADKDLYGGAHLTTLMYWLRTVKHFLPTDNVQATIVHTPLQNSTSIDGPFIVRATVQSSGGIDPTQIRLVWGVNGVWTDSVLMVPTGYRNEYAAALPPTGISCTYQYYISATDSAGTRVASPQSSPKEFYTFKVSALTTAVPSDNDVNPTAVRLAQNYPNPFNPTTVIRYHVPTGHSGGAREAVLLQVFDMLGRVAAVLVDGVEEPGDHEVQFDGSRLASGTYVYRLTVGRFSLTRTMSILR